MSEIFMGVTARSGQPNYVALRNIKRVIVEQSGKITFVFIDGTSIETTETEHGFLARLPEGTVL